MTVTQWPGMAESGSKGRSFGKDGADKVIEVPCGTVVYNAETGEYLCDVTEDGQEVILLKGGRGGLGNWHFRRPPVRLRVLHSRESRCRK